MEILDKDSAIIISNRKHIRRPFDGTTTNKAYLYGFVLGDVHVFKKSKFTLRAITHTTHKSFVDLFISEFRKYGYVNCKYKEKRKEWCLFIDLDYDNFRFLETRSMDAIPDWITDTDFFSFLAGYIDSDGSINLRRAGKYFRPSIRFFGENKDSLLSIKMFFEKKGFHPTFSRTFKAGRVHEWRNKIFRYNHDYYTLEIGRNEEVIRLLQLLQLQHQEKRARKSLVLNLLENRRYLWQDVSEEVRQLQKQIAQEVQTESIAAMRSL